MPVTAVRSLSRRLVAVVAMLAWAALLPFAGGPACGQTQGPGVHASGAQVPGAQAPGTQVPRTQVPGTQAPVAQTTVTKPLLLLPAADVGIQAPPSPGGDALAGLEADAFPLGLHLGMTPEAVNNRLAHPLGSAELTPVPYLGPDHVGSFSIVMSQAGDLRPAITSCVGAASSIVFQFDAGRLYTISFRFARDGTCPDPTIAADELYQRLLAIPFAAMPSAHYRVDEIGVVDAWDPTVTSVIRRPWRGE